MEELTYDKSFKTPVQRAFFESFLLRSRYNVARLYALNVAASSKYKKEVKHLCRERKTHLKRLDNDIEQIKNDLGKLELAKSQVWYLPTKQQELELPKFPFQVVPDEKRKMTMCVPPPIFLAHIQSFDKKEVEKSPKTSRKPLHAPKYARSRLREISRSVNDVLSSKSKESKSGSALSSCSFSISPSPKPILKSPEPKTSTFHNLKRKNVSYQGSSTLQHEDYLNSSNKEYHTSPLPSRNDSIPNDSTMFTEGKEDANQGGAVQANVSTTNDIHKDCAGTKGICENKNPMNDHLSMLKSEIKSPSPMSNGRISALDAVEEEEEEQSEDSISNLDGCSNEYKLALKEEQKRMTKLVSIDDPKIDLLSNDDYKDGHESLKYHKDSKSVDVETSSGRAIKWNDQSMPSRRKISASDVWRVPSPSRKVYTPVSSLPTSSPITAITAQPSFNRRYSTTISTPTRKYSIMNDKTPYRKYSLNLSTPLTPRRRASCSTPRRRFSSVSYNDFYDQCDFDNTDAKFISRCMASG